MTAPVSSAASRAAVCPGDPDTFALEMIKLINDKEFSDIRFTVGEERQTIYAHKCLLAARCEVFRAMFATSEQAVTEDNEPDPLVLSEVQPNIFLALLEFIYTNCCSLSTDMVIDVLAASIEYGLDGLTKLCVRFMRESIAVDTVCEFTQAALTYQQTTLQEECLNFIDGNTEEVFKSQGFNELSEDALSFVLQSDQLQMDEEDILAKVTEWATVNSVVMGQTLGEVAVKVINHVRFGLLDPEKLSQIERDNQQKNFVPVPLISAAWKFHALKKVDVTDPQTRPRAGTVPRESLRVVGLTPQ
ncbi:BTB/POZ domain-containing protein 19 [Geodia barretti]|uniref:BTB/POZ domain-containing protein 19 n=1 Tax=Geodia barretti TaxID=519541 RepID=A0AA35WTL8_GEOBA|nr:BTB/POZ domain-containing protein 19 [Geodia barretti]